MMLNAARLNCNALRFSPEPLRSVFSRRRYARTNVYAMAPNVDQLKQCREELISLIKSKNCNPILVRLAWHDSGTYNKDLADKWPVCGGANGSIRFKPEIDHGANAGLVNALALLEPVKEKCPDVSYADIYQMASAVAIEVANGPKIPVRYGRADAQGPDDTPPEGNLPAGGPPYPAGAKTPAAHLRDIFHRMGLTDQDIVALSGAHTIGRAYPSRSGFGKEKTKYTEKGPGTIGGSSWTPEWLKFDNSYFVEVKEKKDAELLVLETDACLFEDEQFKPFAEKYAADQGAFFEDYAKSHVKLSELGAKWVEGGPVTL